MKLGNQTDCTKSSRVLAAYLTKQLRQMAQLILMNQGPNGLWKLEKSYKIRQGSAGISDKNQSSNEPQLTDEPRTKQELAIIRELERLYKIRQGSARVSDDFGAPNDAPNSDEPQTQQELADKLGQMA